MRAADKRNSAFQFIEYLYWFGFYFVNMFVWCAHYWAYPAYLSTPHRFGMVVREGKCFAMHTFRSYGCTRQSHTNASTHEAIQIYWQYGWQLLSFDGWVASVVPTSFRTNILIRCVLVLTAFQVMILPLLLALHYRAPDSQWQSNVWWMEIISIT